MITAILKTNKKLFIQIKFQIQRSPEGKHLFSIAKYPALFKNVTVFEENVLIISARLRDMCMWLINMCDYGESIDIYAVTIMKWEMSGDSDISHFLSSALYWTSSLSFTTSNLTAMLSSTQTSQSGPQGLFSYQVQWKKWQRKKTSTIASKKAKHLQIAAKQSGRVWWQNW